MKAKYFCVNQHRSLSHKNSKDSYTTMISFMTIVAAALSMIKHYLIQRYVRQYIMVHASHRYTHMYGNAHAPSVICSSAMFLKNVHT